MDSRCAGETFIFIKLSFFLLLTTPSKYYNKAMFPTSAEQAAPKSEANNSATNGLFYCRLFVSLDSLFLNRHSKYFAYFGDHSQPIGVHVFVAGSETGVYMCMHMWVNFICVFLQWKQLIYFIFEISDLIYLISDFKICLWRIAVILNLKVNSVLLRPGFHFLNFGPCSYWLWSHCTAHNNSGLRHYRSLQPCPLGSTNTSGRMIRFGRMSFKESFDNFCQSKALWTQLKIMNW